MGLLIFLCIGMMIYLLIESGRRKFYLDAHIFKVMSCLITENAYVENDIYGAGYVTEIEKVPYTYQRRGFPRFRTIDAVISFKVKYLSGVEYIHPSKNIEDLRNFKRIGKLTREVLNCKNKLTVKIQDNWFCCKYNRRGLE